MQVLYTMLISVSRTRRRFAWCASWNYRKVCTWSACIATAIPNYSAVEYSASRQSMFADSEFHHGRISCRKTNRERKRAEKVSESCLIKLLPYILAENSFLFFLFIFWFRAIITLLFASFRAHAKVHNTWTKLNWAPVLNTYKLIPKGVLTALTEHEESYSFAAANQVSANLCWSKGVEWPAKRSYLGLVAVGVQEQAEDILVPPLLRNCLTFSYIPLS